MLALAFGLLTLGMMPTGSAAGATGNPLWAVSVRALSATRERPIFSPSRRPPSPPALAQAPSPPPPPSLTPAEPDRPPFSILGTVVGRSDSVGIFMDEGNKNILRLHAGQDYAGWVLRAVERRAAKFEKGKTIARLSLPASREEQQPTVLVGGAAAAGAKSDRNGISVAPAAQAQVAASPPVLPERRRRD